MSKTSNGNQPRNIKNGQFLPVLRSELNIRKDMVIEKVRKAQTRNLEIIHDLTDHIRTYRKTYKSDFKKFYAPTDNIYTDNPSGSDTLRPPINQLGAIMDSRVGWGQKVTRGLARAAIRNRMEFVDILKEKVVLSADIDDIKKWTVKTGFWNAFEDCLAYERGFGAGFLVYYWSKEDDFSTPPPKNKLPVAFGAFPPTILTPLNLTETGLLDYDSDVWVFTGGLFSQAEIHKDRIFPLITRRVPFDWLGLSIFEPIWLTTMAYFQVVQGGVKNIAKWGEIIPVFRMAQDSPTREMYNEYLDLVEEYRQNFTFILGQSDSLDIQSTELAKGLTEFTEFLKEDIVSGTGTTLNWLFGRATTGGVGGAGALTAERAVISTISNIQHDISQPLWEIFNRFFKVDTVRPQFQLDLQKTKASRLIEEQMELQNDILKEQLKMLKMQRLAFKEQIEKGLHLQEEAGSKTLEVTGEKPETNRDFSKKSKVNMTFNNTININNRKSD